MTAVRRLNRTQGRARYKDLCDRSHCLLIIELAWGEPDRAGPGATFGAPEWLQVLESESRKLHAFRLRADWPIIERRLRVDKHWTESRIAIDKERYDKYEGGVVPRLLGEIVLDTGRCSPDEVVSEIVETFSS